MVVNCNSARTGHTYHSNLSIAPRLTATITLVYYSWVWPGRGVAAPVPLPCVNLRLGKSQPFLHANSTLFTLKLKRQWRAIAALPVWQSVADPENLVGGGGGGGIITCEKFWSRPLTRNHAHNITANEIRTIEQPENSMEIDFFNLFLQIL